MIRSIGLRGKKLRAPIEIFEPHQRADALIQRMLVADHGERWAARGALHPAFCPKLLRLGVTICGSGSGKRPIAAVEFGHLRNNCRRIAPIVEDVIGSGEAISARELGRHDGSHVGCGKSAAGHDTAYLFVLRTVHDQRSIDAGASSPFEEQRDHEQAIGTGPGGDFPSGSGTDQWVQDVLELGAGRAIAEDAPAQPWAVERPVGETKVGTECRDDFGKSWLAWCRESMGKRVGVSYVYTELGERLGNNRLAAADASREADPQSQAGGIHKRVS